jgi:hypothetical protein
MTESTAATESTPEFSRDGKTPGDDLGKDDCDD